MISNHDSRHHSLSGSLLLGLILAILPFSAHALTAVINGATPGTGETPLAVAFDSTGSSTGAGISYLWRFGDGGIASAAFPSHIFNTAGTFDVTLEVSDGSSTETATIQIVVTGSGAGALTSDMNFRLAPNNSKIRLNHSATKKDSLFLDTGISTVDLPPLLNGLFIEFRINNIFSVAGNLNRDGNFIQRADAIRPAFRFQLNRKKQSLNIRLQKASLAAALAASTSPMLDADVAKLPTLFSDTNLRITIGSQTYDTIVGYEYVSTQGRNGTATFKLQGKGRLTQGFWVIRKASALENTGGDGHFFELNAFIARPLGSVFSVPPVSPASGNWKVQIGDYVDTIPADRFQLISNGTKILMRQPQRERGGIRFILIDLFRFTILIRTWDLPADGATGTQLPLKSENFKGFNLSFRLDFQPDVTQPNAFDFQAVTATRLTRRGTADAFWQTGRGSE